jgi:SAM-dependent methyltransferase
MDGFIQGVVRATVETFTIPEPILEIGSYIVAGQERLGIRDYFPQERYVGIDRRLGPGVDAVENVEQLPRDDASVGTILALNLFEHVPHFWRGFEEIQRVLRPDGLAMVSCPFFLHIHAYPNDYWRFTPDGLRLLLDRMPQKIVGYNGPRRRPLNVWALAAGPEYPRITDAQHDRFYACVKQHARMPMPWSKRLRYGVGRILFGSRPFAPLLEANHFDTHLYDEMEPDLRSSPGGRRGSRSCASR